MVVGGELLNLLGFFLFTIGCREKACLIMQIVLGGNAKPGAGLLLETSWGTVRVREPVSSFWENPPYGFADKSPYLNATEGTSRSPGFNFSQVKFFSQVKCL